MVLTQNILTIRVESEKLNDAEIEKVCDIIEKVLDSINLQQIIIDKMRHAGIEHPFTVIFE